MAEAEMPPPLPRSKPEMPPGLSEVRSSLFLRAARPVSGVLLAVVRERLAG